MKNYCAITPTKAVAQRCSVKRVYLKISQNSQTLRHSLFFNNVTSEACNLNKKWGTGTYVVLWTLKNFKKTFFIEPVAAFALNIFGTVHTKMESQGKMVLHFYTEILRVLQLMVRNSVFVVDFLIPESYSWLKLPTNKVSTKNLIWKRI